MTKMLEIVGTDIRLEIESEWCSACPCYNGWEADQYGRGCQLRRKEYLPDLVHRPKWCPLPEKTDG